MPLADAFVLTDEINRNIVFQQTWGHLRPELRRTYHGFIIFAYGAYGDIIPVACEFDGLPDSPWFFDDLQDFIGKKAKTPGTIYRFSGTYTKFKNGGCRFSGKVTTVHIPVERLTV
jgi:hypothetical protein